MSKFYVAPALFESKSIVANNTLIFHRSLSDATKLLILAMHAIMSCTYTWVVVQQDLQNRMGWGKEKMRTAIKEAVKFGYLRVKQGRQENLRDEHGNLIKGQFCTNEFEFDVSGGFLTDEPISEETEENPIHNECEPETVNPSTVKPCTVKQPLPIPRTLPPSRKQQQAAPEEAAVSFYLEDIAIPVDEKIWLTKTYSDDLIRHAIIYSTDPKTVIKTTLLQTIKWACLKGSEGNAPQVPIDHAAESIKRGNDKRETFLENQIYAEKLAIAYFNETKDVNGIRLLNDCCELDLESSGRSVKIFYGDKDFKKLVGLELTKYGKKSNGNTQA